MPEIRSVLNKKKIARIIGITLAVYAGMKYLLPLVIPFLIAGILVKMVRPLIEKLHGILKIKREWIFSFLLVIFSGVLILLVYFLVTKLLEQFRAFVQNFDVYYQNFQYFVDDCCEGLEHSLGLHVSDVKNFVYTNIGKIQEEVETNVIPTMVGNSVGYMVEIVKAAGAFFLVFISAILLMKDYPEIKEKISHQPLYQAAVRIEQRIWGMAGVYIKAQLMIMGLVIVICVAGLWILKNPYALLIGTVIGILDVLPFIGTGTILIPWAIISLLSKDFFHAAAYMTIFFIANTTREFLEPKLVGKSLGIYPIVILITVYVGLYLFGPLGVIEGPASLLLIMEIEHEIEESSGKTWRKIEEPWQKKVKESRSQIAERKYQKEDDSRLFRQ